MKQRLIVMNGCKILQSEIKGEWVNEKIRKAENIKPGLYKLFLTSSPRENTTYTGVILYSDKTDIYQYVNKSIVKHKVAALGIKAPKVGSITTLIYDSEGAVSAGYQDTPVLS